jgi:ECF sigma factor
MAPVAGDVTQLLADLQNGRPDASQLTPLVYDELHRLARQQMRHERPDHTQQATALGPPRSGTQGQDGYDLHLWSSRGRRPPRYRFRSAI